MFSDDFCFYTGYKIPKCRGLQQFFEAIQALPSVDTPQVFGLHPNADITWVSQSSLLSSLETRSASSFFEFYRETCRCRSIKFSPYSKYLFVSQPRPNKNRVWLTPECDSFVLVYWMPTYWQKEERHLNRVATGSVFFSPIGAMFVESCSRTVADGE